MSEKTETKPGRDTVAETPASKAEIEEAMERRAKEDAEGDSSDPRGEATPPKKPGREPFTISPKHPWYGLWKLFAVVAVIGGAMAGYGYTQDPQRFAFAYLSAFGWGVTIALGGLFFVLIQHITNAGWSVTVRRGAEQLMGTIPAFVLLFIPVMMLKKFIYPWLPGGAMANTPAVMAKSGYFNAGVDLGPAHIDFWTVRTIAVFGIWLYLSGKFWTLSREQDETGSLENTKKMRALAAPAIFLFAISITVGGIDWFMTLDPEWFSTMFGVYIFAGAVISSLAFLVLFFSRATEAKLITKEVTNEHFHDLGKLQFAFTVFWAYIAFSQYILIWYANIPEETVFFKHRQENDWAMVSLALLFVHFIVPFLIMLSRHPKRSGGLRSLAALILLVMHWVDIYWLVMPNKDHHLHINPIQDFGSLIFVAGVMLAFFFRNLVQAPLIPVKDPRLDRSIHFENA
ncbi:MAG: hypothetical protein LC118_12180 [Dehalococcoidia bacterium]|nr:hypothetical protein [Dehalococcoidia bacterium]